MRCIAIASLALTACSLYFADTPTDASSPGGGAVKELVAGSRSTCARVGATWWCWGANEADQITEMPGWDPRPKFSPESIAVSDAVLAMGGEHSCSIAAAGTVSCWGSNWSGQLGRVTDPPSVNAEQNAPDAVSGLPGPALSVSAGGKHTCAVLTDHSLWCWGDNTRGQLGVDVASGPTPRRVLDHIDRVVLGDAHSCAIRLDRSVACWGANTHGELGDGSYQDRPMPTALANVLADDLALGSEHTCALAAGAVTCWGSNDRGQLGDGSTTDRTSPAEPAASDAVEVAARGDHTCVRRGDGTAACWGDNDDGELGDGTLVQRATPTPVAIDGVLVAIAAGERHTCAMRADHSLACWGRDSVGELGDGSHIPLGPQSAALPIGASALAVGAFHACVIAGADHRVYCWGDDHHGQLGDGGSVLASARPLDTGLTDAVALAAGVSHTCAAKSDHSLWCWGDNSDGELGDGTQTPRVRPVATTLSAIAIAAGDRFTCVVTPTSELHCFGRDDLGQLATGMTIPPIASISASYAHVCGVTTAGAALCWGSNSNGQIGNGGVSVTASPGGPAGTFTQIAAGGSHTCAIPMPATDAECWGGNSLDELGTYVLSDSYAPVRSGVGLGVGQLVVGTGRAHTCVSGSDNGAGFGWTECFGENTDGQCALDFRHVVSPMNLASGSFATTIGGGDAFTCTLVGAAVSCWGDNSRGQLGIGTFTRSMTPLDLVISN